MSDCMNSEEEFHHPELKAQVRALGTNSKQRKKKKKKGRYLIVRKRESNYAVSVSLWIEISKKRTSKLKDNQLKISRR